MFYNVENLFDTFDDSLKNDDEFLPYGEKHWNTKKFDNKLADIYKVFMGVGEWEPPALVGLCEIENLFVLEALINNTPLKKFGYRIIHKESPDRRGIDVALIYRKKYFSPDYYEAFNIPLTSGGKTRDILYIRGEIYNSTVHIFINHWPSRYGGQIISQPNRILAAARLKHLTDSLFNIYEDPNIIITGDFNDEPENESLLTVLNGNIDLNEIHKEKLYNLSHQFMQNISIGTYKYQGRWQVFDQFIVSGALISLNKGLYTSISGSQIFKIDILLEEDKSNTGKRPFRTYLGPVYHGGISDHLPVYLDLFMSDK